MAKKQLILSICVRTEISDDDLLDAIKTNPKGFFGLLIGTDYPLVLGAGKVVHFETIESFDIEKPKPGSIWDSEVEIASNDSEDYNQIIEDLYSRLMYDTSRFTDWEYEFISDLYNIKIEGRNLHTVSDKRKEWMRKLRDKYL